MNSKTKKRTDIFPISCMPNCLILNSDRIPLVLTLDSNMNVVYECFFLKEHVGRGHIHISGHFKLDLVDDELKIVLFANHNRTTEKEIHVKTDILPIVEDCHVNHIESGFFCMANEWSVLGQYFHFFMEMLPKIVNYRENAMHLCPLLITKQTLRPYVREILDVLGIPKNKIIEIGRNQVYKVNEMYTCGWAGAFPIECESLPRESVYLNIIRNRCFQKYRDTRGLRNIYISRKESRSANNQQVCLARFVVNEDELLDKLDQNRLHFDRVRLGESSIEEKVSILSSVDNLIMDAGSSVVNAMFAKNLQKAIILSDAWHHRYEIDSMTHMVKNLHPECKIVEVIGKNISESRHEDKYESPFWINPHAVIEALK